jgi:hypothetical protein
MDTSTLDALAASGWPLISSPPVPQVILENPSTLELGLIGIATLAAYWTIRRLSSATPGQAITSGENLGKAARKAA